MSFATIFKPGQTLIERFHFGAKFAIVGLVLLLPFVILFQANWQRINHDIAVAEKERIGLQSIDIAMHFMQQAQLHRRYSRALLQGDASATSQLASVRTRADEVLQSWQAEDVQSGGVLGVNPLFAEVRNQWDNVKSRTVALNIGESMSLHGRLVDAVNVYIAQVGVNASLSRDPDADIYFLQDAAIVRLPAAAESLRLLRASVIKVARQKQLPADERIAVQLALQDAERLLAALQTDLNRAGQATPSVQLALQSVVSDWREKQTRFLQMVRTDVLEAKRIQLDEGKAESFGSDSVNSLYRVFDGAMQQIDLLLQARIAHLHKTLRLEGAVSAAVLLLALYLFASLRNSVVDQVRRMRRAAHHLAAGEFTHPITASAHDEIGDFAQALDKVRQALGARMESERQQSEAMLRVKMALDNAGTPFRIADGKGTVVYANTKMFDVLRSIEPELKRRNPDFSLEGFIGSSIGTLMSNPTEYLNRLDALRELNVTEMEIDGRTFNVTTAPVFGANGERIGTVGEWIDRTEQVAVEREVAAIVNAAAAGDFSKRVTLEDKQGFFLNLGQGINQVLETSERGLHEVGQVLQALARGDLSQQLNGTYHGLFAQLQQDVNITVTNLKVLVSQIRDVSEAINTAAQEIASGNADLSSRTEEQASSLEETASSMEQLSATVRQNADSARQANALADSSNVLATRGGEMVQRVVNTMGDIQGSAKRIADIVGVIDAIAFQTNILALNAAVEAARAGEQGRGFAVVASEVRSLAQRSATAAKEIKELIAESAGKVEHGVTLVEQTGATMSDVVSSFARVAQLLTDISNASREQASGIDQVTRAVGQMDEVTQQNAALVEEAAAAAESLEEQAHGLVEVMARFKLDDAGKASVARSGPDLRDATPRRLGRQPVGRLGLSKGGRPVNSPHPNDLDEEWQEF